MFALSFLWLTMTAFLALLFCFLLGLILGLAWWWWNRNRSAATHESQDLEAEAETDRLRLRVSSLEATEERVRVLERSLEEAKKKTEKVSMLESQINNLRPKAIKASELETQVAGLRAKLADRSETTAVSVDSGRIGELEAEVAGLRSKAEAASKLESEVAGLRAKVEASSKLESELAAARNKVGQLEAASSAASADSGRIGELEAELAKSREDLKEYETTLNSTQSQLKLEQQKTGKLTSDLDECRKSKVAAPVAEPAPVQPSPVASPAKEQSAPIGKTNIQESDWRQGTTKLGTPGANHVDDLKIIKGMGPVMEKTLHSFGIKTWEQIAAFTADDIEKVSDAIDAFPGRIERDNWMGGAQELLDMGHPDPKDIK